MAIDHYFRVANSGLYFILLFYFFLIFFPFYFIIDLELGFSMMSYITIIMCLTYVDLKDNT